MRLPMLVTVLMLVMQMATAALAAPLKVYVAEVNTVGVQNRDEMKITLQSLLASRLTNDSVIAVASAAEADLLVSGTYLVIGKVFSIDAAVRSAGGSSVTRAFVQGDSQDELIPAVGRLAEKLTAELKKVSVAAAPPVVPVRAAASSDIVRSAPAQVTAVSTGDIIRPQEQIAGGAGGWISGRLPSAYNLLAAAESERDGLRPVCLADERHLACYDQASGMKLIGEVELGGNDRIISLDMLGNDIYLTVMRGSDPGSQIWQIQNGRLVQVAKDLPWLVRVARLAGGSSKLCMQAMGRDGDFYGDVYEATRTGSELKKGPSIRLPRGANLYTFNRFAGRDGALYTIVINSDNYLVVYDQQLNELWRSNDRFGGSELYFQQEDLSLLQTTGSKYRTVFMNQRIQVNSANEVLVGKNDGFWVLGNARSYKKGAVYCLGWNGSSLEEKWRTKDTQNYMPDFIYDETRKELLLLQVVQRPGGFGGGRGASSLSIKKVE